MPQIVPITYQPDLDTSWGIAPGSVTALTNFLPTKRGTYGSVGVTQYGSFSAMTTFPVISYLFRQVDGTMRLLCFNSTTIDEYDNTATRTSRGTGYTAGGVWQAAAQGNAIVAVNIQNATQASTGAGFTGLGGGAPQAKFIVSNAGFLLMANTFDGVSTTLPDQVAWSALQNYTSWTPSAATQAGNIRLLDAPGPITALANLRETVIAFKDNAIFIGQYVGTPLLWAWRMVTDRIGCAGSEAVCEYNGVLYFLHSSGVYSFDGSQIVPVGLPINNVLLNAAGFVTYPGSPALSSVKGSIGGTQTVVDDINGTVMFGPECGGSSVSHRRTWFGYNVFSQKWGQFQMPQLNSQSGTWDVSAVKAKTADIQSFLADTTARGLVCAQTSSGGTNSMNAIRYPFAVQTAQGPPSLTTGMIGSNDGANAITRVQYRCLPGTDAAAANGVTANGYQTEDQNITNGVSVTGAVNPVTDMADIQISAKFCTIALLWHTASVVELAGLGIENAGSSSRP